MKKYLTIPLYLLLFHSFCFAQETKETEDILFQRATITSLLKGVLVGDLSLKELKAHDNFGIGTYNHLDGEMIFLDNVFYQIKDDGFAYRPPLSRQTPFACVTFFSPDKTFAVGNKMTLPELKTFISSGLTSKNIPCAIKISGTFSFVKTRSVPAQKQPYPEITEIIKDQPVFEMNDIKGTMIGFWLPESFQGLNVKGFHLHFIDENYSRGGHLLDCVADNITIALDETPEVFLSLPTDQMFLSADLETISDRDINTVENNTAD